MEIYRSDVGVGNILDGLRKYSEKKGLNEENIEMFCFFFAKQMFSVVDFKGNFSLPLGYIK